MWREGKCGPVGRPTRETAKSRGIRRVRGPDDGGTERHAGGKITTWRDAVSARGRRSPAVEHTRADRRGQRSFVTITRARGTRRTFPGKIHTPHSRPRPSGKSNRPLLAPAGHNDTARPGSTASVPLKRFKRSIRANPFRKLTLRPCATHYAFTGTSFTGATRRTDRRVPSHSGHATGKLRVCGLSSKPVRAQTTRGRTDRSTPGFRPTGSGKRRCLHRVAQCRHGKSAYPRSDRVRVVCFWFGRKNAIVKKQMRQNERNN